MLGNNSCHTLPMLASPVREGTEKEGEAGETDHLPYVYIMSILFQWCLAVATLSKPSMVGIVGAVCGFMAPNLSIKHSRKVTFLGRSR